MGRLQHGLQQLGHERYAHPVTTDSTSCEQFITILSTSSCKQSKLRPFDFRQGARKPGGGLYRIHCNKLADIISVAEADDGWRQPMNSCPLFEVRVRVLLSLTPPEASGECCHFVLVLKTWLSDTMRAALRANSFRSSPHQRVKNVLPGSKGEGEGFSAA